LYRWWSAYCMGHQNVTHICVKDWNLNNSVKLGCHSQQSHRGRSRISKRGSGCPQGNARSGQFCGRNFCKPCKVRTQTNYKCTWLSGGS
jgi:hypothetical protein